MEIKPFKPTSSNSQEVYNTSDMVALIDADKYKYIITYRIYKNIQDTGEQLTVDEALDSIINEINNSIKFKYLVFFFSGKSENTFRDKIGFTKKYKGNRTDKVDPYMYDGKMQDLAAIPNAFRKYGIVFKYDDIEADDLISMVCNKNTFIISDDKDLQQIPGLHYNFKNGDYHLVDQNKAKRNLAYQLLVGDVTDNITGIQGIGHVMATKILDAAVNEDDYINLAMYEYIKKHGQIEGIDKFCENWMLLKTRTGNEEYLKTKYSDMFMYINQITNNN
jgi:5'-3' exonuclease